MQFSLLNSYRTENVAVVASFRLRIQPAFYQTHGGSLEGKVDAKELLQHDTVS